ncbi:class I SAM-dependent methyltransferase [Bradyrhizobium sp. F1.13.3]|uniref:class I SAM-dependent methyltransferase n=1 Tax=Bradyrhizobium sp. F1.13.3 TaxID=3156351 RepID=UPI003395218E
MTHQYVNVTEIVEAIRDGFLGGRYGSFNVLRLAKFVAGFDAAQYYLDHMLACPRFATKFDLMTSANNWATIDGLTLEFGVASGRTINHLAALNPERQIFGFDWFKGLPETWRSDVPKGAFAGDVPAVRKNVSLINGLFEDTLPGFVAEHSEPIRLLHVDCDLYSSTMTIFNNLAPQIRPGTIIVFDEYFNCPAWRLHEYSLFELRRGPSWNLHIRPTHRSWNDHRMNDIGISIKALFELCHARRRRWLDFKCNPGRPHGRGTQYSLHRKSERRHQLFARSSAADARRLDCVEEAFGLSFNGRLVRVEGMTE